MGNTFFYKQAKHDPDKLTWKEIFSESFKKHSKADLSRTLSAGIGLNTATERDMLAKWDKPWVWFSALKIGIAIIAVVYALYYIMLFVAGSSAIATDLMVIAIPPIVFPVIILIFLWELNIPKNISLFECAAYMLLGGFCSIVAAIILFQVTGVGRGPAAWAPFAEEPAKLITAVILIAVIKRNKKIYGITGLVIGACVGAGFGAFESVQYAFSEFASSGLSGMMHNQILRGIFALGGHTLFCAPYTAAVAYNMKNNKFSAQSFMNREFIITFLFSIAMHYCWNSDFAITSMTIYYIKNIAVIVLLWLMLLWILKKCLNQVVSIGHYSHSEYVREHSGSSDGGAAVRQSAGQIAVTCVNGSLMGSTWRCSAGGAITLGRGISNTVALPEGTKGVSRQHCVIKFGRTHWHVKDLNSSYGTYVNSHKLAPGAGETLHNGDVISLANAKNAFQINIY